MIVVVCMVVVLGAIGANDAAFEDVDDLGVNPLGPSRCHRGLNLVEVWPQCYRLFAGSEESMLKVLE
jgi:hypothetical protein